MGRLIPVQVILLGGAVPVSQADPTNQYQTPPPGFYPPQQPPPQSGFYPPPYEQTLNPNLPLNK
nr:PREDICTED: uncharacterized protein LOC103315098 isoform X3 [Tribolium castaneum]|eukprot:XP_015840280.1 PREDICTED: uncharacterized protein LOC103315098 isoform X3 [Tribolium castaneum]